MPAGTPPSKGRGGEGAPTGGAAACASGEGRMLDAGRRGFVEKGKGPVVAVEVGCAVLAPEIPRIALDPVEEGGGQLRPWTQFGRREVRRPHGRGGARRSSDVVEGGE